MKMNSRSKPLVTIQCYEDRQPTLPLRKAEHNSSDHVTKPQPASERDVTDSPPPPPPMPVSNNQKTVEPKKVETHNPVIKANGNIPNGRTITNGTMVANGTTVPNGTTAAKSTTITNGTTAANGTIIGNGTTAINGTIVSNGTLKRTPTPDYNNKTEFAKQYNLKHVKDEKAELESLESYKLKNPLNVQPKPPHNYFVRAPNGTATMKKHGRPVSVTIGEYPGIGSGRKEPSKLEFLNGEKINGVPIADDVPITNRLQSELALTLSRSNLRKKTDSMNHVLVKNVIKDMNTNEDSDDSLDKNFHARYGNNILPLPPSITIPKADADR